MVFASILDDLFDDFQCFLHHLFDTFFMFFWSFPNRFLNRANHEIIKNPLVFIGLFALGTFRTQPIFRRISIQKTKNFRIVFSWNSSLLKAIVFRIVFFINFWWEKAPKMDDPDVIYDRSLFRCPIVHLTCDKSLLRWPIFYLTCDKSLIQWPIFHLTCDKSLFRRPRKNKLRTWKWAVSRNWQNQRRIPVQGFQNHH